MRGIASSRRRFLFLLAVALVPRRAWTLGSNVSQLTLVAAQAALEDSAHITAEVARNREVKAFTRKFFADGGYAMTSADANFMMVDIKQDAAAFKKLAVAKGIAIGRAFPPLTNQARITFGTMAEMKKAVGVFKELLAAPTRAAGS